MFTGDLPAHPLNFESGLKILPEAARRMALIWLSASLNGYGKSLIDLPLSFQHNPINLVFHPNLLNGYMMNNIQLQSLEDVYDIQIEHLRAQHNHLKFMHEYHAWMMSELVQPMLIDLHGTILDSVNEALKHLDQLIETLQPAPHAEPVGTYILGSSKEQM